MPIYQYIDRSDHQEFINHRMFYSTAIICATCGLEMWRKPQSIPVNWGGLRPSAGDLHPEVKELIDTADERRDKFVERHEKHERDTLYRP